MSYEDKPLKKSNGQLVPQAWDESLDDWIVLQGSNGAFRVQSAVDVSEEYFEATGNLTKEFDREMIGLIISNDSDPDVGLADLTFTVHGKSRKVKAGEIYEGKFKPFTSVTINSTVPWRAEALQSYFIPTVTTSPPDDTTAPENVTNLKTSNVASTSLTLTWNASVSEDCIGYDVYKGVTLIASVTETKYDVTGLTQNTQYTFTIKAKDAAGNISSGTSTTVTTVNSTDTAPPENVTNLTVTNISQTSLTLNWTASVSDDVASYDVYNSDSFLANVNMTTYKVNGLSPSTDYNFTVKAKDRNGNVASGTTVSVKTTDIPSDTTPPDNVTYLTTSNLTDSSVTLSWAPSVSTDVSGYEIYINDSYVTTVGGISYNATGLLSSTSYTFTVKAKDTSGNVASGTSITITTKEPVDITAPVITVSPASGTYSTTQMVTLTSNEPAIIYYTIDGSNPTVNSNKYSEPIPVSVSTTIKFFAKDLAGNVSLVESVTYSIVSDVAYVTNGLIKEWNNVTNGITYNNDGQFFPATGDFTICVTLKPRAYQNIFSQYNINSSLTSTVRFYFDSTGQKINSLSWGTQSGGAAAFTAKTDAPSVLTDSTQYYHVAFTRDSASGKYNMYVNNVAYYSVNLPSGYALNNNVTPPAEPLTIGASGCDIAHLLYYNRLLDASELTQNYSALK